jgi:hypothetical protein
LGKLWQRRCRKFPLRLVNWITFGRANPGQSEGYRKAQADFNFRGWQGRWRHTASTALFFVPCTSVVVFASLRFFSQPGDLRFQGNYSLNAPPKLLQIAGGADE